MIIIISTITIFIIDIISIGMCMSVTQSSSWYLFKMSPKSYFILFCKKPIEEISRGIRQWEQDLSSNSLPLGRIFIHSDLAQAIGKLPVNVQSLGIDYGTIVGHKVRHLERFSTSPLLN